MANIKIHDLHSPSYLDDLNINELMLIYGGTKIKLKVDVDGDGKWDYKFVIKY
ncbi:hypothetical protein [Okeania sp. SIO1H2]|uniref:hypothetical protein n=1 Tax=Okeania sp. SIO1H2 TaxID=2607775 RepID=UPI0013BA3BD9|nr:hypothetical protein [Okeania sp. SIO1H2]NET22560.1 hypothetical protein [Okeania sp. SIO1H5]NET95699.1 hypothetical protein [Okeania sp. SIO1H2]